MLEKMENIELKAKSSRIFGLDLFRAIAIIWVVMGHGEFMLENSPLEGFPFFRFIDGVDIFFVLSGFLIGGILLKEINKPKEFTGKDLLNFWKRRWFRTLPNYYLILILNYFVVKNGIIQEKIAQFSFHYFTFTQNFKSPMHGFFWESWSLSIEEWFYLIMPIFCFLLLKKLTSKQAFFISAIIMIIFPLIYRFSIVTPKMDSFWWDVTFRKTVLTRLDSIGYGLLASWLFYYYKTFWDRSKKWALVFGVLLILFLINVTFGPKTLFKQTFYFSILPISVMLFLPMAEAYKTAKGIFAKVVSHISKISYSMYLINLALVAEVIRDNFKPEGGIDGVIKYICYWAIVIAVSSLLFKYYEKPMTDLRDKKFFSKKSD